MCGQSDDDDDDDCDEAAGLFPTDDSTFILGRNNQFHVHLRCLPTNLNRSVTVLQSWLQARRCVYISEGKEEEDEEGEGW